MADDAPDDSSSTPGTAVEAGISITVEDGLWIADDEETGLSSQGPTKADALRNLAATLETVEEGETDDGDDWL
ncbi:type II toxin-antitoxin system HicB family antitoxin [Halovivax limisalsi]|uniref:type II toxin-antitoxin system HicB family antitoxin n=1 Tax=Halovivax limisalsi TaxID=1453760 RepID=UPI001FFD1BBD|nr:hypothetical protein [Halovivax limisalsi]